MAVKDFEPAQLDDMIAQCADALRVELEAERAALAKSSRDDDPGDQSAGSAGPSAGIEGSPEGSASASGSASGSGSPMMGDSAGGPPEGAPPMASPDAAPSPTADPTAAAAPSPDAGAIEPAPTVEALQAEYMKLPPDQKRIHYLAAKAALLADMGGQGDMGAGAPPSAAPSPAPAPAAAPASPPMAMGEMGAGKKLPNSPGNGGSAKLGKSEDQLLAEAEVEVLRKQVAAQADELKAQTGAVERLSKAMEKLTTPIRKSIKGVSDIKFIPRTDDGGAPDQKTVELAKMSKSEIQDRLKKAIRGGKLTQADKDRISEYNVGAVDVTKVQHLLVDAK